jgi:hypothetical protein
MCFNSEQYVASWYRQNIKKELSMDILEKYFTKTCIIKLLKHMHEHPYQKKQIEVTLEDYTETS